MALKSLLFLASSLYLVQSRSFQNDLVEQFTVALPVSAKDSPDCTCLTRVEERNGGIIQGRYSYLDPVGSLIEVKYTMNPDKTNYIEERKVIKNYVSSGQSRGGLTIEQVVERVLTDIRPTVIQVIRSTVQGSDVDLTSDASRKQLVQMIIVQMRPVVFQIVTEVLEETNTNYLDAGELTDLIVVELTPVIEQGVNEEAERLQAAAAANEGQVVTQIISDLKPTVIRIIQATVSSSGIDLSNVNGLVQTILVQLRPVVSREVQNALRNSPYATSINAQSLTGRIIVEITPFVRQALQQEVQKLQQANSLKQDQIIQQIIADLKPTVIRIIQATVSSSQVDLSNIEQLLQTILIQLKPVVLNEVQEALKTSTLAGVINASTMADRIIVEITSFVRQALQQEVQRQVGNLEDRVVTQVIGDLKPTVIRIVQATVSSSSVDISNTNKLIETIMVQLRPVVLNEVKQALTTSPYPLNAQSLTERIVVDLRPFVAQALEREVAKLTSNVQNQVVQDIQSQVNSVIKNTVNSASVLDLENPQALVDQILAKLRPLVLQAVRRALQSSSLNLDAQNMVVKIIIQLTPSIETGVQKEVQVAQVAKEQQIQALYDEILAIIPPSMSGVVKQKVSVLMQQADSQNLPESVLVERIIASLQGDVIGAIEADSRFRVVVNSNGFAQLMQRIMSALRPIIIQEIQIFKSSLVVQQPVQPVQSSGSLSSIFGVGGRNTVKVNTPAFNYGYETSR